MVSDERPNDSASSSGEKCFSVNRRPFVVGSICPIARGTITRIYRGENLPRTFGQGIFFKYRAENFWAGLRGVRARCDTVIVPNVTPVALAFILARFVIHGYRELAPRFLGLKFRDSRAVLGYIALVLARAP
jgi:hypothetical protein